MKFKNAIIEKYLKSRLTNYGLVEEQMIVDIIQKTLKTKLDSDLNFGNVIKDDPKFFSTTLYDDLIENFKKRIIFKKMGEKFLSLSLERKYCEAI